MTCSLSIITASAETFSLASSPCTFSPEVATRKPRDSAVSSNTLLGSPGICHGALPPPNGQTTLWFQPRCEAHGAQPCAGLDGAGLDHAASDRAGSDRARSDRAGSDCAALDRAASDWAGSDSTATW